MKNKINNDILDPEIDYESPDGLNRFRTETDDYYDDIWQEMIMIDGSTLEFHKEFVSASKVFNPMQAAGLWFHTSIEAEESINPLDRRHEILKMMWGSKYLSKYDIPDFQEFKAMIENIDPFAFYVFTEVLYKTNMILYHGLGNTMSLEDLEAKLELLKNNTTKNNHIAL